MSEKSMYTSLLSNVFARSEITWKIGLFFHIARTNVSFFDPSPKFAIILIAVYLRVLM